MREIDLLEVDELVEALDLGDAVGLDGEDLEIRESRKVLL